jgi:N-acetylglucosaminyldiphosphoundecaprenol N-acetyl-beta-D-mannosaminyltransferase
MRRGLPFGLRLSDESALDIARRAVSEARQPEAGVGLVVTPNIDHIATIRRSAALARAYERAERIVCDGWPVQLYARFCGHRLARVTGCEIASALMRSAPFRPWHHLFFVVDSDRTRDAVLRWARRVDVACTVEVPPFGFGSNAGYCRDLAERIRSSGTTILMMAVGAPHSEIFVDTHRALLPPCWAFCVGQAVKVELGLVRRAPAPVRRSGLEWLWRIAQEPSRLTSRYARASIGFGMAVLEDQRRS